MSVRGGPLKGQLMTLPGRKAQFLKHFTADMPWVHLDIAGVAYDDPSRPYAKGAGGTGFGVRLLLRFLQERAAR